METSYLKETIVAVATPPGEGAIGIVRLSGPGAVDITDRLFRRRAGRTSVKLSPYRLTLGRLRHPKTGQAIDEVLAVFMPGPRSYTGEDMVEFQAHGGKTVMGKIVQASVLAGARPAQPGEFSKRAFLNGRLDLAQAEAVIDLIRSHSDAGRQAALAQLGGRLSGIIREIREKLAAAAAGIEAILDFGEEDDIADEVTSTPFDEALETLAGILSTAREGRILRDGLQVVLAGRTNVGKSSILNMLVDSQRSIVTPLPGTTRDTIESPLLIDGMSVLLIDTAGFGRVRDPVEAEGIRRSREKLLGADLAVIVIDCSTPLLDSDRQLLELVPGRPSLVVLNKTDLPLLIRAGDISRLVHGTSIVEISARTGEGLEDLRKVLGRAVRRLSAAGSGEDSIIINARHEEALRRSMSALERGKETLEAESSLDLAATNLREALSALGEITGETVTEEVLERIFSRFCIGK